jgi:hypothetical protein
VLADPADTAALLEALRAQQEARPARELVREAVRGCDREAWLSRMEALCRACAGEGALASRSAGV